MSDKFGGHNIFFVSLEGFPTKTTLYIIHSCVLSLSSSFREEGRTFHNICSPISRSLNCKPYQHCILFSQLRSHLNNNCLAVASIPPLPPPSVFGDKFGRRLLPCTACGVPSLLRRKWGTSTIPLASSSNTTTALSISSSQKRSNIHHGGCENAKIEPDID